LAVLTSIHRSLTYLSRAEPTAVEAKHA
jgi:hypothetical protein